MTAELSKDVVDRLTSDHNGWLTTVAKSGQPVPKLVWFCFDSDGNGGGIVAIGGAATIDAQGVDCRDDPPYWAKYGAMADQFGLTESMGSYSTRLRIGIDRVWVTPTEG